jgi:predicted nucleotidyltransferase
MSSDRYLILSSRPAMCHEQAFVAPALAARRRVDKLPAMHPIIESHRDELIALAHRRGVTRVRVFGSMSRGDASDDSDIDLLVTLSPGTSALALGGLLMDAEELLGRRVDVVTEAGLHPALRDRVLADAVPL